MSKKSAKSSGKSKGKQKIAAKAKPAKKAAHSSAKPKKKVEKKTAKKAKPAPKKIAKKVIAKAKPKAIKISKAKSTAKKKIVKPIHKKVVKTSASKPQKAAKPVAKKTITKAVVAKTKAPLKPVVKTPEPKKIEVKEVEKKVVPKIAEVKKEVKTPVVKKGKPEADHHEEPAMPVKKQATLLQALKHEIAVGNEKQVKEPAGKFELEYVIHASAPILFEFLTSPSGLSEWFCDDLNIRNGIFSFVWDGVVQPAKLIKIQEDRHIRFQWLDKPEGTFFEFRIDKDDLTSDISLIVTDFADSADEQNSSRLLWDSQIHKLMQIVGSYF